MPTERLSRTDARRACILVVDDEPLVAALIADALGLEGYEVETAKDGREALEKIAARSYDVILSDLRMPELDGVGLYRELEQRHESLLRRLRGHCPVPDDLERIRRRAQWFFLQIASKNPAVHFARIAGLDSGVCILMSAAEYKTRVFSRAPAILRIFNLIRNEEARHVKFSRKHALELGLND